MASASHTTPYIRLQQGSIGSQRDFQEQDLVDRFESRDIATGRAESNARFLTSSPTPLPLPDVGMGNRPRDGSQSTLINRAMSTPKPSFVDIDLSGSTPFSREERTSAGPSALASEPADKPQGSYQGEHQEAARQHFQGERLRFNSESTLSDSLIWTACAESVWNHEEEMVKKWNNEIDALLVFAGLFSAALTTFNVQYVSALNPQTSGSSASNSTSYAGSKGSARAINSLWLSALVFSLAAASIAISVKQWLNQFTMRVTSMPRQNVIIWYSRHRGFEKWKVEHIINILPILLQIALFLFFMGLVELLWALDHVVFYIITPIVIPLLLFSICTAVTPALAADCPYRSPQAWWIAAFVQWIKSSLGAGRRSVNWIESERDFVTAQNRRFVDAPLLVAADATVMDDVFLKSVIQPYISTCSLEDAPEILAGIIQNRVHGIADSKLGWNVDRHAVTAISRMTFDVLYKAVGSFNPSEQASGVVPQVELPLKLLAVLDKLIVAMYTDSRATVYIHLLNFIINARHKLASESANRLADIVADHAERFIDTSLRSRDVYDRVFNLLEVIEDKVSDSVRTRLVHVILNKSDWLANLIQQEESRLQTLISCIPQTRAEHDALTFVRTTVMLIILSKDLPETTRSRTLQELRIMLATLRDRPSVMPFTITVSPPSGLLSGAEDQPNEVNPLIVLEECLAIAEKDANPFQRRGFANWRNLMLQIRGGENVRPDTFERHAEELFLTRGDAHNLWRVMARLAIPHSN